MNYLQFSEKNRFCVFGAGSFPCTCAEGSSGSGGGSSPAWRSSRGCMGHGTWGHGDSVKPWLPGPHLQGWLHPFPRNSRHPETKVLPEHCCVLDKEPLGAAPAAPPAQPVPAPVPALCFPAGLNCTSCYPNIGRCYLEGRCNMPVERLYTLNPSYF